MRILFLYLGFLSHYIGFFSIFIIEWWLLVCSFSKMLILTILRRIKFIIDLLSFLNLFGIFILNLFCITWFIVRFFVSIFLIIICEVNYFIVWIFRLIFSWLKVVIIFHDRLETFIILERLKFILFVHQWLVMFHLKNLSIE